MVKKQEDRTIILENGNVVKATFPIVVSASRSTDIPAFYADWFFHRLNKGYSAWTNPFNGAKYYVSYEDTKFIVFWSKNPRPLLARLDELKEKGISCYIQYTLNDYEAEKLEKGVRPLAERIETFKLLVEKLGKGAVIWRFDPLILTETLGVDDLIRKIEFIGDSLYGYTEKLVFSFADIVSYRKVKINLEKNNIPYKEWDEKTMIDFASKLAELNKKWGYELATCGEKINIEQFGIKHNHCIDDRLIVRLGYRSPELRKFLNAKILQTKVVQHSPELKNSLDAEILQTKGVQQELFAIEETLVIPEDAILLDNGEYAIIEQNNKDKGQREFCGCMKSKDIGEYNTCPHLCEYCYANTSKETAVKNYRSHSQNKFSETITGR